MIGRVDVEIIGLKKSLIFLNNYKTNTSPRAKNQIPVTKIRAEM